MPTSAGVGATSSTRGRPAGVARYNSAQCVQAAWLDPVRRRKQYEHRTVSQPLVQRPLPGLESLRQLVVFVRRSCLRRVPT